MRRPWYKVKHQPFGEDGGLMHGTYLGGKVERWHTVYGLSQSNADHSWGVAMFLLVNHPDPSPNLLKAALVHDVPEVKYGDAPSDAKVEDPGMANAAKVMSFQLLKEREIFYSLTDAEHAWLKLADMIESVEFLRCQPKGNERVSFMIKRTLDRVDQHYWKMRENGWVPLHKDWHAIDARGNVDKESLLRGPEDTT